MESSYNSAAGDGAFPPQRRPEEAALLRLARGEPVAPALAACRADKLAYLASAQMVLAPLAKLLLAEDGVEANWRFWASAAALATEKAERLARKALMNTVSLLRSIGIDAVVLKGISLALGRPRDSGDIDLLIPEGSLVAAIETLEAAGYEYKGSERNTYIRPRERRNWARLLRWETQYEFLEPETGTLIELHTAFFETSRVYEEDTTSLRESIGEFASSSVIDGATGLRCLSKEDRVLLLALHAGLKRSPSKKSFILRSLLDFEALIDTELDWGLIVSRAERFRILHHVLALVLLFQKLSSTRQLSGIPEQIESRMPEKSAWLARLHTRCVRSVDDYSTARCILYRTLAPFILDGTLKARIKAALLLPAIFPTPYELRSVYNLPIRSPAVILAYPLEPFRWCALLIRKMLIGRDAFSRHRPPR